MLKCVDLAASRRGVGIASMSLGGPQVHRALSIVLLLVIATILNVGGAWLCAYWQPPPPMPQNIAGVNWTTHEFGSHGDWMFATQSRPLATRAVVQTMRSPFGHPRVQIPPGSLPRWSSICDVESDAMSPQYGRYGHQGWIVSYEDWAFGWPLLAMTYRHRSGGPPWPDSSSLKVGTVHLPLRPAWAGFIANTLIYVCGLWLAAAAFRAGRSVRRRWAGRCPQCAYRLAAPGICPECGWRHQGAAT
jgi:hypothetical protein